MWTTAPDIAKCLRNKEDGYKYTVNSNQKLEWVCEDCGDISVLTPNKFNKRINKGNNCSKNISYGEKFIYNLLEQLCVGFELHKTFEWSECKEYDFYIPEYSCIIEVNGKQHYTPSDFSYLGGKTYYEEEMNDEYKKDLALKNKILNYIVIDARYSSLDWIKQSVRNSDMQNVLYFSYKEIDWAECNNYALTNTTKLICEKYNELKSIKEVSNYFKLSPNTIKNNLKQGNVNGLCNYDPKENKKKASMKSSKWIIENLSKPVAQYDLEGKFIKGFSGINQANREIGCSKVWECVKGRRKTSGGYQWRYYYGSKEDIEAVKYNKNK